mgnify:CR=1 FL=1
MDDLDARIVVAVVPQFVRSLTDASPIHRSVWLMYELLHNLPDGHGEIASKGVDDAEVILCDDVLASSERSEPDHVVERWLAVQRRSAE